MSDASTKMVIMPALGMTQDTGEIVAWHKEVGDSVNSDDILMEVETDKTTMEVEAGFNGYVAEIRAAAGTAVEVGSVVAVLTESSDGIVVPDSAAASSSVKEAQTDSPISNESSSTGALVSSTKEVTKSSPKETAQPIRPKKKPLSKAKEPVLAKAHGNDVVLASPKAKLAAHEKGVSLTRLMRSGVELPIQMADLSSFNAVAGGMTVERSQLQARVAATRFIEFAGWLGEISDGEASATTAWCMFGAAAIRQAMQYSAEDDVQVQCENWVNRELDMISLNPDAEGLLDIMQIETTQQPDLLIRNMTGTNYFNYQPSAQDASVSLSIVEEGTEHYLFSLSFDEQQISLSQALVLLQCLGERTEQPLRHLL